MHVLLLLASLAFILLAIHPFTTYPLSLRWLNKTKAHPPQLLAGKQNLKFGICVCAYNEEAIIAQLLERLIALRQEEPALEILVYVDTSSDRTAEIAENYRDQLSVLHLSPERHGKTYGMNLLVSQANADILLFTDASVVVDPAAFNHFREHFRDSSIGAVCGKQCFTHKASSVTANSNSLYWRIEEKIKQLENISGSIMTLDGSLYALRKELRIAPPDHIVDDFFIPFMIIINGHRVIQSEQARSFEPAVTDAGEEFKRKIRIACQGFTAHRLLWPLIRQLDGLTVYKYLSHKVIRWFGIYFMALAYLCFAAWLLLIGANVSLLALLVITVVTGLLGIVFKIKPFSTITDILLAFTGAGLGVLKSLRGERFKTWEPPASARATGDNNDGRTAG